MSRANPRYANGGVRRKNRARLKAQGLPCHICHRPIHYDEPSDAQHPWSFVIDEKIPVSRYWLGGYESPRQAAESWENLQPMHYRCNQIKRDKTMEELRHRPVRSFVSDGDW